MADHNRLIDVDSDIDNNHIQSSQL